MAHIRKGHAGKAHERASEENFAAPYSVLINRKMPGSAKKCYCIKSRQKKGKCIFKHIIHNSLILLQSVRHNLRGEAALGNYGPGGRNFIKHFLKANKYVTRYLVIWI
jgi:hypothetical protein